MTLRQTPSARIGDGGVAASGVIAAVNSIGGAAGLEVQASADGRNSGGDCWCAAGARPAVEGAATSPSAACW